MNQPKYQINDVLYHKEKDIYMFIDNVELRARGFLYTLKTMIPTYDKKKGREDEWKKYYEEKIEEKCARIARKAKTAAVFSRGNYRE